MQIRSTKFTGLAGAMLTVLLLCLNSSAMAHRVIYEFSGVTGQEEPGPFSGSLYFDTDNPFVYDGRDTGWVTHGRTGVLTLHLDGITWQTTPGVDPLCEVDFHEGWSVVRAWCSASRKQTPDVSDGIIMEFFEPEFRIFYRDFNPIGPYDEHTLNDYVLTASLWAGPDPHFAGGGSGTVDRIRVVPEPGVAALLTALVSLPFAGRRRAPPR